ncbi:MAG: FAD-binding oxidoreductase [Bryobacteraceae bacterium]|nr:FAD-binding oxidoreductase [Bryobacteraceae bacterium]MDW8378390.1 FAD-binding oxidoreductase [Bryobacterales bacterium]
MSTNLKDAVPLSYLEDASGYRGYAEAYYAPSNEEEVLEVLARARETATPVTVVGAGTGVTGGRCAHGGWVLSLEKFRRLEVNPGWARAGAGVSLKELQAAAAACGMFYAPDPTEWSASVGGTIATNASGSRSFRYGDTRRHVLGLRVALMDGSVLELRRGEPVPFEVPKIPLPASRKHSAGYLLWPGMDYLDLFVGSEGTLGVVLEAELKLLPAVADLLTGVVFFSSEELALAAVAAWRPVPKLRMLEYMDAGSLALIRPRFPEIPRGAGAALLIEQELDGEDSEEIDAWEERLRESGALEEASWFASQATDRERFRRFRHALPELVNERVRRTGFLKIGSDYAVPFERNEEMMRFYRQRLEEEFPGRYVIFGHIGDAHVHVNILPESERDSERGRQLMVEFAAKAVELGGTVGAEHGLGKRKSHLLHLLYASEHFEAMKAVKRRLDPQWLLGRDTLFDSSG